MRGTQHVRGKTTKLLVLNPNSSKAMTDGMNVVINSVDLPYSTEIHTYTGPEGAPPSINDGKDLDESTEAVLEDLETSFPNGVKYDGIVVACYSVHPLVPAMQQDRAKYPKAVTGIFEASILAALSVLAYGEAWGIVTTGKFWEKHLAAGVRNFLGAETRSPGTDNSKFVGVESTGLNASDFHHGVDPAVVRQKLKEATKRLLSKGRVRCVVMGCAGMAGLEDIIREAASEENGEDFAHSQLHVVDGVRAAIMQLEHTIRYQRLLPGRT
ncbi:Asp/Glu/hydantoin racemase [Daldinia caldariorum]|uniref:Asp/Glu/hydantoin racemase n=1 Tax=Daldinia caldariorum TaxID=326644 RepID=UPI002008009D|nr:Asp/Glu/hydantoin racemase [Daldinia caldariorum]KAI1466247.1 Asp/Glu/hydantoin racemase [Daldinia caldariorum]